MFRKIFGCLFLSALLFAGCSVKETDKKIVITYQTMETLPKQRKALEELVQLFEKENPDIKVKVQTSTSSFQKLKIQIAGGNAPDVFYFVTDRLPQLVYRNVLLSMDDFLAKEDKDILNQYFPQTLESCKVDGQLYCFPFHFSTDILFYNKNIFDAANVPYPTSDWTWADFKNTAAKLTKRNSYGNVEIFGALSPRPLLLLQSMGGLCFDSQNKKSIINSADSAGGLEYLLSLYEAQVVPKAGQLKEMDNMDGITMFISGKAAMLAGRTYMLVEFSNIDDFDWDVALIPKGKIRYSRLAVGGNCISATTKHPEAAFKFVKFFSGQIGSDICGRTRNCVPAHKEIAHSDAFSYSPPANHKILLDSLDDAVIENYGLSVWVEFKQKARDIFDQIVFGEKSIEEGLALLETTGNNLLEKENKVKEEK